MSEKPAPEINIRFIYNLCSDLAPVRRFYGDVLGMRESAYDEGHGWLCYDSEGFQLMFFRGDEEVDANKEWAGQPGGGTGTAEIISWSVHVPEVAFAETVKRILEADVRVQGEDKAPDWRQDCYWGITVMDPVGNTVEVYTSPKEKPAATTWPGK